MDFFAGSIYYLLGIPEGPFYLHLRPRSHPCWALQCIEQYEDNILIRPLLEYSGKMDLEYVPIGSGPSSRSPGRISNRGPRWPPLVLIRPTAHQEL